MPWRQTKDPYAVWVSEMMLQQTQVVTATPYWIRWMERFPSIKSLAEADLDTVLTYWQGLGYYARARNMHKAALETMRLYHGDFPSDYTILRSLPGVGPYTAAAVSSISVGEHHAVVDANVVRVLCRLEGIKDNPKSASVQIKLQSVASENLLKGSPGDFNQAMMELGATLCTPKSPCCARCPIADTCIGFASGNPEVFPERQVSIRPIKRTDVIIIVVSQGLTFTTQLPLDGLWGGLYSFPRRVVLEGEDPLGIATALAKEIIGSAPSVIKHLAQIRHAVTIYNVHLIAFGVWVDTPNLAHVQANWKPHGDITKYPMPNPQVKVWNKVACLL